jgi:hypothetical protein
VVQRTPEFIADNESLHERSAVMSARCTDSEEFCPAAREDYILFSHSPLNHSAVWNLAYGNSRPEVWFIFHVRYEV